MRINYLSETAITITLADEISIEVNTEVINLVKYIQKESIFWVKDIVPAYSSVSVFVDFSFYSHHPSLKDYFEALYKKFKESKLNSEAYESRLFELEVEYNGIDLIFAADYCRLTIKEFIKIHSDQTYAVGMIGFSPGFPYLMGLDPRLFIPRKETPLLVVPKGSVAIGGQQTGIYPRESPGGWHIIGTVTKELFDPLKEIPSLLQAGDRVKFVPL